MKKLLLLLTLLLVAGSALALPFDTTTSPTTYPIRWYYLKANGYYLHVLGDELAVSSSASSSDDYYLWCFVNNPQGKTVIYNKGLKKYQESGFYFSQYMYIATNNYVDYSSGNSFYICFNQGNTKYYLDADEQGATYSTSAYTKFTAISALYEDLIDPAGTLVFPEPTVYDDHCTISFYYIPGDGDSGSELILFINGTRVGMPYSIPRTNEVQTVEITARVEFSNTRIRPIEENVTFEIPALEAISSPFVTTPSPTTYPIHWYQLKVNDKYVYYDPEGDIDDQIQLSSTASTENNFLWCFVQTSPDKILIYNRAAKKYLKQGQYLESDTNNSRISYVEEKDDSGFYICYFHTGDNRKYYLYETNGGTLGSTGIGYASTFNAIEVSVENGNQPSGEIVFSELEVFDDHCTFGATYTGNEEHQLYLYLGTDELVENPYSVPRTYDEPLIEVTARVVFTDPNLEPLEDATGYYIPALEGSSSPFVTTPSPTTLPIHWYQLKVNDKYVYYDPNSTNLIKVKLTTTASTENNFLWCFVEASSDKIVIYNRAAKQYLQKGTSLKSDINDSYLSQTEMDSGNNFYLWYHNEGDNRDYYLFDDSDVGHDYLGSGGAYYAEFFNAIEILVEEDLGPVIDATLTPYDVHTPNNVQTDPAEDHYKLFDKNKSTKWCVDNSTGSWETIWVDFKSDVAFTPTSYTMTTGNDTQSWKGRNPKKWKIYAKAKESDSWTTIVDVTDGDALGLGTANTTDYSFDINGVSTKYQFFRFEVSEVRGKGGWQNDHYVFQLAELALSGYGPSVVAGDVNSDGSVNAADVTALHNYILNGDQTYIATSDVNKDGAVNAGDVTAVYNIILGNN